MEISFIHDKIGIKILILFILRRLPSGIDRDKLAELAMCDSGVTYFDFAECLGELIQTEHVQTDGMTYTVTEKGRRNGEITEPGLPYTVRQQAERATAAVASQLRRSVMLSAEHTPRRGGGYTVTLRISDGSDVLMQLELFARSETEALRLETGFSDRAETTYTKIMDMLLSE